jgi:hypothetical protein
MKLHAFRNVLDDKSNKRYSYANCPTKSSIPPSCPLGGIPTWDRYHERGATLTLSTVDMNKSVEHSFALPSLYISGLLVTDKVVRSGTNHHFGYRKRFSALQSRLRLSVFILVPQLLFAKSANAILINSSLFSQGTGFSSQTSFATSLSTDHPPQRTNPLLRPPDSLSITDSSTGATEEKTSLLASLWSQCGPAVLSLVLDVVVIYCARTTGWPRTATLITALLYIYVGYNIAQEPKLDLVLGVM